MKALAHLITISVVLTSFLASAISSKNFPIHHERQLLVESQLEELGEKKLEDPNLEIPFNDTEIDAINKFLYFKDRIERVKKYVDVQNKINLEKKLKALGPNPASKQKARPNMSQRVTVHLIPHTHDDVGWTKSIDEYYTGFEGRRSHARVEQILDQVVYHLQLNQDRRFTYVEMKYFYMWYTRQSQEIKDIVKQLVQNGQFEITMGGWSATDEACPNYEDIINNMYIGHGFLKREFGITPKVAWMLDSFGHTQANAALFSDMGFEALFIGRVDYQVREQMKKDQSLVFLWRPLQKHFGNQKQILTQATMDGYSFPPGFKVDERLDDDGPVQNDTTLDNYNAEVKAVKLINHVTDVLATQKNAQNVMLMWGDDFSFMNSEAQYKNLELIIGLCNKINTVNMNFIQSTPQTYVNALKNENVEWPTRNDDLLPYASDPARYWTGFYSSRPGFKKAVKDASSVFGAHSHLFARRVLEQNATEDRINDIMDANFQLLDSLGISQHHDVITGTEKQYVANDYRFRLQKSVDSSRKVYSQELSDVLESQFGFKADSNKILQCVGSQNDTVHDCPIDSNKAKKEVLVTVHNQQVRSQRQLVRILLPTANYKPQIWNSKKNQFDDVPFDIFEQTHLFGNATNFTDFMLYIDTEFQPEEIKLVKLTQVSAKLTLAQHNGNAERSSDYALTVQGVSDSGDVIFQFENKLVQFAQSFGFNLKKYFAHQKKANEPNRFFVKPENYTDDEKMNNDWEEGAYVFKPEWYDQLPHQFSTLVDDITYQSGQLVEQWSIFYKNCTTNEKAVVRVRYSPAFQDLVEFEVELAPVPVMDEIGKDITANWKFFDSFDPNSTFFTDSNGLEMQQRQIKNVTLDNRLAENELGYNHATIAANYFPIDSAIAIRDHSGLSNLQVTIMNDRPQGGSADLSSKGSIELMQHRRLLRDDDLGLEEFLNETGSDGQGIRVTARYQVQIFDTLRGQSRQRNTQINNEQPLQYSFVFDFKKANKTGKVPTQNSADDIAIKNFMREGSIRIYPMAKNQIILRLENMADTFDDRGARTHYINLQKYARDLYMDINGGKSPQFLIITETSLSANQPLTQIVQEKHMWRGQGDSTSLSQFLQAPVDRGGLRGVALEPQRIRSFTVTFNQEQVWESQRNPRSPSDNINPLKVIRNKHQMKPLHVIKNHRLEVSVNGKDNVKYTKNIMQPHDPIEEKKNPATKPSPVSQVKTNPLSLSGAHDYHRQNGIGDQTFPGKPVPLSKEELAKLNKGKKDCDENAKDNKKTDKIQLKQVSVKKI